MDNPLAKLAPQFFGDYPKPFLDLYKQVYIPPDINQKELKDKLWKALSLEVGITKDRKESLVSLILIIVLKLQIP